MLKKHSLAIAALAVVTSSVTSMSARAADERWTFDGNIQNNSLAISPDELTAVVSYSQRSDVVVYDLKSGKVRKVLNGYVTPRNIVFAPSGDAFYLSDSSLGIVRKIDTKSLKTLVDLPLGAGAFGTALGKDGRFLYVNNQAASTLSVVDLEHQHPVAVVSGFSQPRQGIRISPDGNTVYVTNFLGDKITLVDRKTNKIKGEINGFNKLRAISISADGNTLYAANSGSNTIAIVDTQKRSIINTVTVGKNPYGAALTPDGLYVYSGNLGDNSLSVIDTQTMKVTSTVSGLKEPRQAIIFTKDQKKAYVLNKDLSISTVDLKSNKVVATLKTDDK
ncbi:beta-propeller fold lactonase family protein [Pseudomonas sp. CCM 7891]|uniref:Beta-propeller fold lactonase family protein n=1 Tax=Pseudomonas karstica TaxID=1055468 RepID=A0A7X2RNA5_9PSED|nr:YncE family protein [Pseudomonas karstica]MTD17958.1 beta-propeller fold lactonase family protein [Pseudomonas karstica]